MVLGKLPVPARPTIWITVGQGPTALAVGAGGVCLDIFIPLYPFSLLSPSLWETVRYRLKYCLKGPLNPKQPTNQPIHWSPQRSLVSIGKHFVTTRIVHLPKRAETSLITESDRSESDKAVRAVHTCSCNSWFASRISSCLTKISQTYTIVLFIN